MPGKQNLPERKPANGCIQGKTEGEPINGYRSVKPKGKRPTDMDERGFEMAG